jgi:hypothetical protein
MPPVVKILIKRNIVDKENKHSKYYFEVDRNGYISDTTGDKRIPSYYIGKYHKYEARKVIEDFDLSYNIGTAVTYLLRAEKKHDTPIECIKKAIAHLEFELEQYEREDN